MEALQKNILKQYTQDNGTIHQNAFMGNVALAGYKFYFFALKKITNC